MHIGAWTVVALVACLSRGVQPNPVDLLLDSNARSAMTLYFSVVSSSSLTVNIQMTNSTIADAVTALNKLMTPGQTEDLVDILKDLKKLVNGAVDFGYQLTGALTKVATDKTAPLEDLFDKFLSVYKRFAKYTESDFQKQLRRLKKSLGCTVAKQFEVNFQDVFAQVKQMAKLVKDLQEALGDDGGYKKHKENPSYVKNVVNTLASSVLLFREKVAAFVKNLGVLTTSLETANTFLKTVKTAKTTTKTNANTSLQMALSTVETQSKKAMNKYLAAQVNIKTDLSSALTKLAIFTPSKSLSRLVDKLTDSYAHLYHFLERRNWSDVNDITAYYNCIGVDTVHVVLETIDIFVNSVDRTVLKATDILLERGPYADTCFTGYSSLQFQPYSALSMLIDGCVMKETTQRWAAIADAVEAMLKLAQFNSQELAMNLARCSTYQSFATVSADFSAAEKCLKTVSSCDFLNI